MINRQISLTIIWLAFLLCMLLCTQSCSSPPEIRFYTKDTYPVKLSAWGLVTKSGQQLHLGQASHVYDLNSTLFSDYALKLRTLYLPEGQAAQYADYEAFDLPTGSIISKTFMYQTDASGAVIVDTAWDGDPQHLD